MWARNNCNYLGGIYFNRVCSHHLGLPKEWWATGNYLIPVFLTLSFCTWPLFRAVTSSAITTLCSSLPVFIHSGVNYACSFGWNRRRVGARSARGAGEWVSVPASHRVIGLQFYIAGPRSSLREWWCSPPLIARCICIRQRLTSSRRGEIALRRRSAVRWEGRGCAVRMRTAVYSLQQPFPPRHRETSKWCMH